MSESFHFPPLGTLTGSPRGVVEKAGRWRYHVWVEDGAIRWGQGDWGYTTVWGRTRAARAAKRYLNAYKRKNPDKTRRFYVA